MSLTPTTPATSSTGSPEKAQLVLSLLRGAGLKPPFGLDQDVADDLWGLKLGGFDTEILTASVAQWISADSHEFPSVGELNAIATTLYRERNRRRAETAGAAHRIPGQECPYCEDTGYETGTDHVYQTEVAGVVQDVANATVKPCRLCKPEQAAIHAAGCFGANHYGCSTCKPGKQ